MQTHIQRQRVILAIMQYFFIVSTLQFKMAYIEIWKKKKNSMQINVKKKTNCD